MERFEVLIEHVASLSSSPSSYRRQFIVLLVLPAPRAGEQIYEYDSAGGGCIGGVIQ